MSWVRWPTLTSSFNIHVRIIFGYVLPCTSCDDLINYTRSTLPVSMTLLLNIWPLTILWFDPWKKTILALNYYISIWEIIICLDTLSFLLQSWRIHNWKIDKWLKVWKILLDSFSELLTYQSDWRSLSVPPQVEEQLQTQLWENNFNVRILKAGAVS